MKKSIRLLILAVLGVLVWSFVYQKNVLTDINNSGIRTPIINKAKEVMMSGDIVATTGLMVEIYELANLDKDLSKDGDFGIPISTANNMYQLLSNNDAATKAFITALQDKDYKTAASLVNMHKYDSALTGDQTGVQLIFPLVIGNAQMVDYGAIPFYNGVLGFQQVGQDSDVKLYYITIQNNKLYIIKSKESIYFDASDTITGSIDGKISAKVLLSNKDIVTSASCMVSKDSVTCDTNRFLSYLQGKEKSPELDQRQDSFKKQIMNLTQ